MSFNELQNFEFEHIASSSFFHFSSLEMSFGLNILSLWPEYFESFMFYQVWVCLKHKSLTSSLIELENWVLKLVEFSSFEKLVQALNVCKKNVVVNLCLYQLGHPNKISHYRCCPLLLHFHFHICRRKGLFAMYGF